LNRLIFINIKQICIVNLSLQMSVEISSQNDSLCVAPSTSQPPSPAPPPPSFPDFLSIFARTFQNNIMLPTTTFGASTGGCCAQCIGWGTFNKGLCSNTIANVSSLDGCCITTTVPGTTPPITIGPPVSGITVTRFVLYLSIQILCICLNSLLIFTD